MMSNEFIDYQLSNAREQLKNTYLKAKALEELDCIKDIRMIGFSVEKVNSLSKYAPPTYRESNFTAQYHIIANEEFYKNIEGFLRERDILKNWDFCPSKEESGSDEHYTLGFQITEEEKIGNIELCVFNPNHNF